MTLDLEEIAARLRRAFPDAAIEGVGALGAGFDSTVVETAAGDVFRIGKNGYAAGAYAMEARLLPALQGRLPVAVPNPRWYSPPAGDLPHGALGYRKLPGVTLSHALLPQLDADVLARDVAAFFAGLHAFPADEARSLGLPERSLDVAALRDEVMPALATALDGREISTLDRWWDAMLRAPAWDGERALCHIDAWHENMLVDPATSRLTGVLDFGDAGIDDPACDFAPLRHVGDAFADAVLAAYGERGRGREPSFSERIDRYWQLREFWGVRWSLRNRDSAEFEDAVRKLRAGPVLRSAPGS